MKNPLSVRRTLGVAVAALLFLPPVTRAAETNVHMTVAPGPFKGSMESLKDYKCPDWFRDAKFGIWAHWGPQAVPMAGDWYAKKMYMQGSPDYKHHLETYGHPSEQGYKDIIPLWKAEKWDPDRLMALYKKAGAKYFVSMGSHHDNFYLWNSRLHRWNAVNMGPKRDVVGDWQKAAQKQGLRFGVSEHLGASFTWFQSSHKADTNGPKAGVPYDGADPKYQDLYHFPAEPGDTKWYSNDPRWHQQWYDRIQELVDTYHPDLLYTDGAVPFGNEVGLNLIAHLYNSDASRHNGATEVIYNCKQKSEGRWVEDLERGVMPGINPHPWQTDTSIGDWFYNKNWKFRPVSWTIHMLVDIVSKNGNLLLNVVQRPDGSLDPQVEADLAEMASWIPVHGEAIYGTRPWLVYGEGNVRTKGGHFKEDFKYTSRDIRFTTKGSDLFAFALGWPTDGKLAIRSLAAGAGKIDRLALLGSDAKVTWEQTPEALIVTVPAAAVSPDTCALRINGTDLKPVPLPETAVVVQPDAQGNLTLEANDAEMHGDQLKVEEQAMRSNIGHWDKPGDWVSWKVKFAEPGTFKVSATMGTVHANAECVLEVAGQQVVLKAPRTASWADFKGVNAGTIRIEKAGEAEVKLRARDATSWKAINVRTVKLVKQ